jgi:hypothetical protein
MKTYWKHRRGHVQIDTEAPFREVLLLVLGFLKSDVFPLSHFETLHRPRMHTPRGVKAWQVLRSKMRYSIMYQVARPAFDALISTRPRLKRSGHGRLTMAAKSKYLSNSCQQHLLTREICHLNVSNICQTHVHSINVVKHVSNTCQHLSKTCQTHLSTRDQLIRQPAHGTEQSIVATG